MLHSLRAGLPQNKKKKKKKKKECVFWRNNAHQSERQRAMLVARGRLQYGAQSVGGLGSHDDDLVAVGDWQRGWHVNCMCITEL
jgi:hypothetical protein